MSCAKDSNDVRNVDKVITVLSICYALRSKRWKRNEGGGARQNGVRQVQGS